MREAADARIIVAVLVLSAFGLLAGGCGSGGSSTMTGTPSSHPSVASTQVSKARALAYAHEVNLIAPDVPGAVVSSQERESGKASPASVEFARCAAGVSPSGRVANIKSATFRIGSASEFTQVKSSVEVMPSAALAAQNYAAIRSARGHTCLARLLPRVLQSTATRRARFGAATTSFLANLLPTGQESFGVRITTNVTANVRGRSVRLPVYLDEFGILAGPAEVNLTATSITTPVPSETERRLLSLLYSRAEAHKL